MKTELDSVNFFKQAQANTNASAPQPMSLPAALLTTCVCIVFFYFFVFHIAPRFANYMANEYLTQAVQTEYQKPEYEKISFFNMKEDIQAIDKLPLNDKNYNRIQSAHALNFLNEILAANHASLTANVAYSVTIPAALPQAGVQRTENYQIQWDNDRFLIRRMP